MLFESFYTHLEDFFPADSTQHFLRKFDIPGSSSCGNDVHFHQLETPKTRYFPVALKKVATFLCFLGSHLYRQKKHGLGVSLME